MGFTTFCFVLTSSGLYKNITELQIGESIINMRGESIKVLDIIKTTVNNIEISNIKHYNWFLNTTCTQDSKFLISRFNNGIYEMKWLESKDIINNDNVINEENVYNQIFGNEILPFELGVFFGLVLYYGDIREEYVYFDKNLIEKIKLTTMKYTINEQNISIKYKVPEILPFSNDINYLKGLFIGMGINDNIIFYPKNLVIFSMFIYLCSVFNIYFEHDTPDINEIIIQSFPVRMINLNTNNVMNIVIENNILTDYSGYLYDIITDCPTKSFILNGMICKSL